MLKIRKKRPCCICRRWFAPRPQARKTQVTCDNPKCKKEKHRRQCEKWNRKNKDYFKLNYIEKKLSIQSNNKHPPPHTEPIPNNINTHTQAIIIKTDAIETFLSSELFLIFEYLIKTHITHLTRKKKRRNPG